MPNVPTFAEVGYSAFDASFYFAVAAPTGTPRDTHRVAKFKLREHADLRARAIDPEA